MGLKKIFALVTIAALPLACSDKTPTQPVSMQGDSASTQVASPAGRPAPRSLPSRNVAIDGMIGTWGGPHLTITIGASSAILSFDCAHGTIDEPFATDAGAHFALMGTYIPEAPGPVQQGDPVVYSALYAGTVTGKTMTFTVTEVGNGQMFGPFVLTLGVAGRVVKCL